MKNCFNDFVIVLWPMTVNSHNENNILKRISRSNNSSLSISSITTTISTGKAENNTPPKMNVESNFSIASSTSSTPNDFQTTLSPGISLQNKNINDVDTFQNTLPDQSMIIYIYFFLFIPIIKLLLFVFRLWLFCNYCFFLCNVNTDFG